MITGWSPTRRRSKRKKIKDTTALTQFVQEAEVDRPARARRGSTRGAPVRMGRQRSRSGQPNAEADVTDNGGKLSIAAMSAEGVQTGHDVSQLLHPPASEILDGGGLRLMRSMSVFLTQDERIILADPSSGMAALVTGVAQVSDAELATIAAAQKACLPSADASPAPGAADATFNQPSGTAAATRTPGAKQSESSHAKSDVDNPSEHGTHGLAGALAGLLALKSGEVPAVADTRKPAAAPVASPPKNSAAQGAPSTTTKRQRNSSPPASRPKSARAAKRAASTALKAQSPPLSSAAPVAVPHVPPIVTHAVPPVIPPTTARDAVSQALNQTAEQSGAAPMHILDMWQTAKPDGSAVPQLSAQAPVEPFAGTALRDTGAAATASADQQQAVACVNLPSTLIAMIRGVAPAATSDVTAQLPQPLPESSKASLSLGTGSPAVGTPSAFSAHQPFSQLAPPQSATGTAFTQNMGLQILPIEKLCNVNRPSQATGSSLLVPGVLDPAAAVQQTPADVKAVDAVAALGTVSLPAALDCPVASCPPGDSTAATAMRVSKHEAAEPLTHPDGAGAPSLKPEKMAHKVSSINSLNCGLSMDTSAREAETSQNVTEGSILANGSEFTSRVATSDAALFSAELRPHASVSSLPRSKAEVQRTSSLPRSSVVPGTNAQDAAGDGSGAPTPENTSGGRVSSLKQDNADNRTLQRRARNRDAARRTRLKKMLLLQGGESRVMSLADEVEARTVELKGIQQQVQEARTLNQRLRARLTSQEPVAAREATAAV